MTVVPVTPTSRVRPVRDAVVGGAAVFLVSAVGLGITYAFARQAQVESVQRELVQVARVAASTIDVDLHLRLDGPDKDGGPDYQRVVAPLAALQRNAPDIFYLYTLVPAGTGFVHGVDTGTVYRAPGDTSERLALGQPYQIEDADLRHTLETRSAQVNAETWHDPGRVYLSAYAPFFDRRGHVAGIVEVDMWARALEARLAGLLFIVQVAAAGLVLLSLASGALLLRLRRAAAAAEARDHRRLVEVADAHAAAEASSRARSEFLGTISHELRTPLNAILGYSELLQEDFEALGDTSLQHDVRRIAAASRHLSAIIGDILDYSKLDTGRVVIAPVRVDVADLLHDLTELLRPGAAARGLALGVDISADARDAWVDPVRLRQVLLNLMGNALKFTERGGVTVRVRRERHGDRRLTCTVYDSGMGIPDEMRSRLFQPFSQLDASAAQAADGTGLGLIISRRLVEAMGGTLRFRSRVGRGSAFRLAIPSVARPARAA